MSNKMTGLVKWFNSDKGGCSLLIVRCFSTFSAIQSNNFRTLEEGQQVEFSIENGAKSPAWQQMSLL
ncbi:cold shock domain-containing protein [Escherichia coli]|nr:cold shock domain-containing protein [Escherichia coli]